MQFEGFSEAQLEKRAIVFDLDNVLVSKAESKGQGEEKLFVLLQKLSGLEKAFSSFNLFLVSGYHETVGKKILAESGLEKFFLPEKIFFVPSNYSVSLSEFDKIRYEENIFKDSFFQDDYFKQTVLSKIVQQLDCRKEQVVFVCHDLLTDAYYCTRFSGIEPVLVKDSVSLKHQPHDGFVKGLIYAVLDWDCFRKILLGKEPKPDYSVLQKTIERFLQREIIGGIKLNLGALAFKKKQKQQDAVSGIQK